MKHFVVPVDLSKNSKDAVRFAVHLAETADADITIIHSFSLLQKAVNVTTGNIEEAKDPKKWILKRIKKINVKHPGLTINFKIFKTDILKSLKKLSDTLNADLIVMGAQGEHENNETFLGSVSSTILKETTIPVLLIPSGYKYHGIKNIALAVRSTFVKNKGTLEPVVELTRLFKSHVQLLHPGVDQDPMLKKRFSIFPMINEITRYDNDLSMESIEKYIHSHNTDLICLIRGEKGLLDTLPGPSLVKVSRSFADIPLLILIDEK